MFDFTVYPDNSPEEFKKACGKIESLFPDAEKKKLLVDVDGSTIQTYVIDGKSIDIFDDYDVGAVYLKSELDLITIFK